MREATVADIDLGRLDQALGNIGVPGFQSSNEEQIDEQVEIGGDGLAVDAERAGKLSGIQQARLMMGQHHPEAAQRFCRDSRTELRDIALKIGADEILPPGCPGREPSVLCPEAGDTALDSNTCL